MREIISLSLMTLGAILMLIAGVGIFRMPDLFLRMSAATKAATLGAGLTLLAVATYFGEVGITSRAIAIAIFLLLTAPVAAHMIARAAYSNNIPLWKETKVDQLRGQYNEDDGTLASYTNTPSKRKKHK